MTFRKFIKLIHIHPILIVFIVISVVTGTFVQLFILLMIVFIHETGHFMAANKYKWRIHSIVLWVFGGVMKTDELGNRPLKEDIVVTIAGPIQHIFIFIVLMIVDLFHIIPDSIIDMALYYNVIILLFNLLPIYPLDGGKLLFFILSYVIPFKQAHRLTILFSIVSSSCIIVLQITVLPFTLSALLIIIFILFENRTEWKNHYYIFIRFLLNCYAYERNHLQMKPLSVPPANRLIDVFTHFSRHYQHEIYTINHTKRLSEQKSLMLYFKEKLYTETVDEIMNKHV